MKKDALGSNFKITSEKLLLTLPLSAPKASPNPLSSGCCFSSALYFHWVISYIKNIIYRAILENTANKKEIALRSRYDLKYKIKINQWLLTVGFAKDVSSNDIKWQSYYQMLMPPSPLKLGLIKVMHSTIFTFCYLSGLVVLWWLNCGINFTLRKFSETSFEPIKTSMLEFFPNIINSWKVVKYFPS